MKLQYEQAREELLQSNAEFHCLVEEHARYDRELAELLRKRHRRPEDEIEKARLKKLKLQAKDRMEELIHECRRERAEAVQAT